MSGLRGPAPRVFADNPKREVPLFSTLNCARPSFFLEKSYDENVAKFRDWKRDNPTFGRGVTLSKGGDFAVTVPPGAWRMLKISHPND